MIEIKLRGTPREIGLEHGKALSTEIRKTLDVYLQMWMKTEDELPTKVAGHKKAIQDKYPHLAEEIKAIAEGAGLSEDSIYAINCRTELMDDFTIPECTAVAIPPKFKFGTDCVLAQNWDFTNMLCGLTRIIDITTEKARMKMLIEPGMVGKIGMNQYGVGVCLNFLDTRERNKEGIPVHILLRGILECKEYEDAEKLVHDTPRASSANYLVADYDGQIGSFETTPQKLHIHYGGKVVVHTNSFNGEGEYCARQEKMERILRQHIGRLGVIPPEALKETFRQPGIMADKASFGNVETIHTVIMNLTQRRLLISDGARGTTFKTYEFNL